jgi:hypothetical protein
MIVRSTISRRRRLHAVDEKGIEWYREEIDRIVQERLDAETRLELEEWLAVVYNCAVNRAAGGR